MIMDIDVNIIDIYQKKMYTAVKNPKLGEQWGL